MITRCLLLTAIGLVAATSSLAQVLFDDFSYSSTKQLSGHGWIVRTADGWPGVPGARWLSSNVTLVPDPDHPRNRILRMTSSTDGTPAATTQTQVCHQRKYLEGTYAARVRFSDQPVSGPGGDQLVESFYMISPLKAPMDPTYSELDYEYLPNGGWGETGQKVYGTTWFTFSPEPNWQKDNVFNTLDGSEHGWHTLVLQVGSGKVHYFIDGKILAEHGGKYYPRSLMSINFNLWFIKGGFANVSGKRAYEEDIDWVYHQVNTIVAPADVETAVANYRRRHIAYRDAISAPKPTLDSPCNF